MDIAATLKWIEATALATSIRDSLFLFPMLESIHVIGLALVFGMIFVLDLRMLGLASAARPFEKVARDVLRWTWAGFATTLITGSLMFTTNAGVYVNNSYFRAKMLLLAAAGINMAIFELTLGKRVAQWGGAMSAPRAGRIAAALSIAIWIGVICTGRLVGFTTSRVKKGAPTPPDANLEDLFKP